MALSQILYQGLGPMQTTPIQFSSPVDGTPVTFYFGGSGYASGSETPLEVQIMLDGNVLQNAMVYANEGSSHKSLVCMLNVENLSFGSHTITLVPQNMLSDDNDSFMLTMIY